MYLHAVKWVDVCAHVNVLQNISNLGFWVTHACLVFHNVEYCSVGYCQTVGEKKHDRLKSCSFESVVFSTQAFPLWRAVLVISQHSIERVIGKSLGIENNTWDQADKPCQMQGQYRCLWGLQLTALGMTSHF